MPWVLVGCNGVLWLAWLALWALADPQSWAGVALIAYLAWMGLGYAYYRHAVRDLFMLAAGVLSAIVCVVAFFRLSERGAAHGRL